MSLLPIKPGLIRTINSKGSLLKTIDVAALPVRLGKGKKGNKRIEGAAYQEMRL